MARRRGEPDEDWAAKPGCCALPPAAEACPRSETETEWECAPVGFYWSVHGRPKWKYIVVEKSV